MAELNSTVLKDGVVVMSEESARRKCANPTPVKTNLPFVTWISEEESGVEEVSVDELKEILSNESTLLAETMINGESIGFTIFVVDGTLSIGPPAIVREGGDNADSSARCDPDVRLMTEIDPAFCKAL